MFLLTASRSIELDVASQQGNLSCLVVRASEVRFTRISHMSPLGGGVEGNLIAALAHNRKVLGVAVLVVG